MLTISRPSHSDSGSNIDRQSLQALGVLMPIRLSPLKFLPGRHPLGRPGDGLRFLRTRRFQQGEDNPKDIDKFSPPDELMVIEWEEEAQASIAILADVSASMALPLKASLRNASLLQLTYSLWRAGDRVGTIFFSSSLHKEVKAANLKTQMERLSDALATMSVPATTNVASILNQYLSRVQHRCPDLLFLVSDFVSLDDGNINPGADWRTILNRMRHNLIPVVITFEVPSGLRGLIKLWDPERRRRRMTWFSQGRISRINNEEKERVASLVEKFRAAGLDYLVISSQRQIYPQLANLARQRRRRKN